MFHKRLFCAVILAIVFCFTSIGDLKSQEHDQNRQTDDTQKLEIDTIRVGIVSQLESLSEEVTNNKVSITIESILNHYIKEVPKDIHPVHLTDKYHSIFLQDVQKKLAYVNMVMSQENLDSLILIDVEDSLDTLLASITIFRAHNGKVREVYKEIFKINLEELFYGMPPESLLLSIPEIINSLLALVVTINTNVKKASVYFNGRFITYADPDTVVIVNIGKYKIKVEADGHRSYEKDLTITSNTTLEISLKKDFFKTKGFSVSGEFVFFEEMFQNTHESIGISTWYSFLYYFSFKNIHRLEVGGSLLILNVTRSNTAYFYNNTSPFKSKIPFTSFSLFADFKYAPVFSQFHWLSPFVGGGIGFTFIDIEDFSKNLQTPVNRNFIDISFYLVAGVCINIIPRVSLFISFRYLWLGNMTYYELSEFYIPQEKNVVTKIEDYYKGCILSLGLRVNI